jgi:hypothetical protein
MEQPAPLGPRLVKKIVVGYELKAFPPALIRSYLVLRRKLEKAGYAFEAAMRPLNELPPEVDVLFVAQELMEAAQRALPGAVVMPLVPNTAYQPAFDELLARLEAGTALYAQRAAPAEGDEAGAARSTILRYRGNDRVF